MFETVEGRLSLKVFRVDQYFDVIIANIENDVSH